MLNPRLIISPKLKNVACPHATPCQPSWMMFIFMHASKFIIDKPAPVYLIINSYGISSSIVIHTNIPSKLTFSREKWKKTRFCSKWIGNLQLSKESEFSKNKNWVFAKFLRDVMNEFILLPTKNWKNPHNNFQENGKMVVGDYGKFLENHTLDWAETCFYCSSYHNCYLHQFS